jgi:hypothetical protein
LSFQPMFMDGLPVVPARLHGRACLAPVDVDAVVL